MAEGKLEAKWYTLVMYAVLEGNGESYCSCYMRITLCSYPLSAWHEHLPYAQDFYCQSQVQSCLGESVEAILFMANMSAVGHGFCAELGLPPNGNTSSSFSKEGRRSLFVPY